MIEDVIKDADRRMGKSVDTLNQELAKVRTGRAHPSLLDHVLVDYYGSEVPVGQAATVSVLNARTLSVQPWDKSMVKTIEKAIMNSDLGLNPVTAGEVLRIPLPPLTEERRREMTKVVRAEGENTRVAIRNVRRDANHTLKDMVKDKMISEDDERRGEERIQKITDSHVAQVDEILADKEKEVMEI